MDASTLSVVIPLFNKGNYIERALSSIAAQTVQPLEIIVVDDGSTDDGPERVRNIHDQKIVLMSQENRGPGAARNSGLARAAGKYVAFLDADDEWFPTFLEEGTALLEDHRAGVTVVCTGRVKYPGNRINSGELDGIYEVTAETDVKLVQKILNFRSTPFVIMRTEAAKKAGGFFDRYKCLRGEDRHLFIKLLFNERIGIISRPLGIYHAESSDLCGRTSGKAVYQEDSVNPFLLDPNEMLLFCPPQKRRLLQELLTLLFLEEMKELTAAGNQRMSYLLLKNFTRGCPLSAGRKIAAYVLVLCSPLLPALLMLRGMMKMGRRGRP